MLLNYETLMLLSAYYFNKQQNIILASFKFTVKSYLCFSYLLIFRTIEIDFLKIDTLIFKS